MSDGWPLKRVALRVRDLESTLAYYQRLGFTLLRGRRADGFVSLGAGERELLTLHHTPDAPPRQPRTAGLYHFAILLPDETALGSFLRNSMHGDGVSIDGASDHLVSQALYLNDPEGNGIEVYADRPREQWPYRHGQLDMDTRRLNVNSLLAKAEDFHGFPSGTVLGHMHLAACNLDESLAFYQQTFGLALTLSLGSQAGFVSWDGYHHHLGFNTWGGPNARQASNASGLEFFEISHADLAAGTYQDPNGITILVSASAENG